MEPTASSIRSSVVPAFGSGCAWGVRLTGHEGKIECITERESLFPDAFAQIDQYERGLLQCEMGAFRSDIEKKMEEGNAWYCEQALRFIAPYLHQAGLNLDNAIAVSLIEALALGEQNERRYKIVKERMPPFLRAKMRQMPAFWR